MQTDFEDFMEVCLENEAAARTSVEIFNYYTEEGLLYARAQTYKENQTNFIAEIESFISGVAFAKKNVDEIEDTEARNFLVKKIIEVLVKVEM